nr:endonuclease domain-containing 1 protein-like [Paramormyrops kingsleyae]
MSRLSLRTSLYCSCPSRSAIYRCATSRPSQRALSPHTSVVEDFNRKKHSKDLLFMETPPHSFPNARFKICQRLVDMPRNATQYDPKNRISIYSAYTFKKTEENWKVDYPWMYEPQLTLSLSLSLSPLNMQPFPQCHLHMKFEDSQAVLEHYANTVLYERGHLNPDQHQSDPHKQVATYTLTNVKPWHEHKD